MNCIKKLFLKSPTSKISYRPIYSYSILDKIRFRKQEESKEEIKKEVPEKSKEEPKADIHENEVIIESEAQTISKKNMFKVSDGPHLFISKLLYTKGPMKTAQLWAEYQNDPEAMSKKYFNSRRHLRRTIIQTMIRQGKVRKGEYNPATNSYPGFVLEPAKAFKRTDSALMPNLDKLHAEYKIHESFKNNQRLFRINALKRKRENESNS